MTKEMMVTRSRKPFLARIDDLECSPEWMNLNCDINNLEKKLLIGNLMRSRNSLNSITTQAEEQELKLVKVKTTDHKISKVSHINQINENIKINYQPQIWFEKTYFCHDPTGFDKESEEILRPVSCIVNERDENLERNESELTKNVLERSATFHDENHVGVMHKNIEVKPDLLFRPGSVEFQGSRERLHEIFEHNRLLRRKFFADTPGVTTANTLKHNDADSTTCGEIEMIKRNLDLVNYRTGFGSTETLTSQSNQSGSSNGRKSRVEFDNSPEPVDNHHQNTIFGITKISEHHVFNKDESHEFSGSHDMNECSEKIQDEFGYSRYIDLPCQTFESSTNYTDNRAGHQRQTGSAPMRNSDYNNSPHVPRDGEKFFATYVRIEDESDDESILEDEKDSHKTQSENPKDVNRNYNEIYNKEKEEEEEEKALMKDYVSVVTHSRDYMPTSLAIIKNISSKSLSDLSTIGLEHDKKTINKSCNDLTITQELRSPQLVNSFTNSMIDLIVSENEQVQRSRTDVDVNDADRRKSIGSSTPGTGTTLPSVYGPIPYKSPRRYVEGEVTIHYRSPVRTEAKEILSEEELARRSAENMRRVYQEERRRKYLQELHDIDSRRHTDNFVPSQKSPIPLNRYDDFLDDLSYRSRSQEQTPEPRLVARAMYNFVGQTSRELSFRRGDIILVRRQIDKNWYEGEHNAMIGLFPINYVEILPYDSSRSTPKKSYEGQARAKFNFLAQTNLELSLAKGELVVLTRRVDENWYEGRIGNKKGIFPVTYVEVLVDPGQHRPETPVSSKPVASPAAHSMLSNGTASGKMSMGPHHYTPSIPVKTNTTEPQYISLPRIGVTERNKLHVAPVNETLHIDTHSDTIPYRALYNYRPQNEDELELKESDTVYVMEKCDDGWFVGSSQRTGYFGTFPGNYVERL